MDKPGQSYADSSNGGTHSTRRKAIREDLTRRLREVCSHMSDEDFRQLVEVMAERQLRSEQRSNLS